MHILTLHLYRSRNTNFTLLHCVCYILYIISMLITMPALTVCSRSGLTYIRYTSSYANY